MINNIKKPAILFVAALAVILMGTAGMAADEKMAYDEMNLQEVCLEKSSLGQVSQKNAEYTEYVLTDKDQIAEQLKIDNVEAPKGKEIVEIVTVIPNYDTAKELEISSDVNLIAGKIVPASTKGTIWLRHYLKNVSSAGTVYYPNRVLNITSGGPGGTITQTINRSVSASFSANVGVKAEVVTAGVGFSVTGSFGISDQYSRQLASNECGEIRSWALYSKKTYQVWNDYLFGADDYAGSGSAYKPSGVKFVYYKYN